VVEDSVLNNRWSTSYSETVHSRLQEEEEEWYLYHTLYRQSRETWTEIPAETIASHLRGRPDLKIGNFGCGECLLADALGRIGGAHEVIGMDHVAVNEDVIACDMAHSPLEDESLGAAVFSLSLMGRNWRDYLKEAHRILQPFGLLFIAEPSRRWTEGALERAVEEAGFDLIRCPAHS
jgi:SAM-dependent methyltransferase